MALNIKDTEDGGETGNSKMGPPVHKPKTDMSGGTKAGIAIGIVAAVCIGLFMMYKAGMFGSRREPVPQEVFTQPVEVDTAAMMAAAESLGTQAADTTFTEPMAAPPKQEMKTAPKTEEPKHIAKSKPEPKREIKHEKKREAKATIKSEPKPVVKQPVGSGNFTIYIGSYSSKTSADEEAGRWSEAGYQSFVSESSGKKGVLFRVCLGRYPSRDDARRQAEKLKDAFEGGYWVDAVK